ncbi:MAG: hypothetical protein ACRDDY_03845 [Clostridium sp.]|uniref:hypothetical protein n=1 Tax=Clostridium sp. TaxID=1506 RepID=UPI003EE6BC76
MKKVLVILALTLSMGACSSLKEVGEKHKAERKELRAEQREEKMALNKELSEEIKVILSEYKAKKTKLKNEMDSKRKVLEAKHLIEFTIYSGGKFKDLEEVLDKLNEFLK